MSSRRLVGPHSATAQELKHRLELEREGNPFLIYRDGDDAQVLRRLPAEVQRLTIGRSPECDVAILWDPQVSRVHAELERVGAGWAVVDGGLSRNGSMLNGDRLQERRRLADGDLLLLGDTPIMFRQPVASSSREVTETVMAGDGAGTYSVTKAQRAVLLALCRPYADGDGFASPATNNQIADELVLSLDAIKGHLRALFVTFGVDDLPQNQKRLRLAERAMRSGVVTLPELQTRDG